MYKKIMIGMVGICLMLVVGTAADAAVCIAKAGGRCLMWSGSLTCGVDANGLGNCTTDVRYLGCEAKGSGTWMVACGNGGSNNWPAPGIQTVELDAVVGGITLVQPDYCDKNGNAYVEVNAEPSQELKNAILDAGGCPNHNWVVIDAVPCHLIATDYEMDANECILADATFECYLPSCDTLAWDQANQTFEKRQYECTRTAYNRYKEPQCPPAE